MKRAGAASEKETSLHQMPESYYKGAAYPGKMGKAGMPADSSMRDWPTAKMGGYPPLDDTMAGIESCQKEGVSKAKANLSYQK